MRYHGCNSDGEELSSMYVSKSPDQDFGLDCSVEPSLTRQEFSEDCDVNTIMARYEKTGVMPSGPSRPPAYLDLVGTPDLQESLSILAVANQSFMQLPATVRREFDHDPAKFVAFCQNEENLPRMRELGLAKPLPVDPPPQRVEIVNPPPPAGEASAQK